MTKTDMIARLEELGGLLGRQIDTSGTATDLELRLRETELEYAELSGAGQQSQIIARLEELGGLLGRQFDTTGTEAELQQLLSEAELEYAALNQPKTDVMINTAETVKPKETIQPKETVQPKIAGYVCMTPLCTLHIRGRDPVTKKTVEIAVAGRQVEVPAEDAEAWLKSGKMKPV